MYYRELETVPGAKERYDAALKSISADRMKKVASLKKLKKKEKKND